MAIANQVNVTVVDATSSSGLRGQQYADFIKGNFSLSNGFTVQAANLAQNVDISATGAGNVMDEYTLVQGDFVLLSAQTTAGQNGIYLVGATSLTIDPISSTRFANAQFPLIQILNGHANVGTILQQTTAITTFDGTIFSTPLAFVNIRDNVNVDAPANTVSKIATVTLAQGDVVALDPGALGNVVKCDCTVNTSLIHNAYGVVVQGATAGKQVTVATGGEATLPNSPFVQGNIGANVFVDPTVIGGFTLTVPATVGTFMTLLGKVSAANKITLAGVNALSTLI